MMKRLLIIFLLIPIKLLAPQDDILVIRAENGINPYEPIWEAVCQVESSGDSMALNVKEQAYGIVQIRQVRLDDYVKRTGIVYTLQDCYDKKVSKSIFMHYAMIIDDTEIIARNWNGGPDGVNKKSTKKYWNKVKSKLYENKNSN